MAIAIKTIPHEKPFSRYPAVHWAALMFWHYF